MFEEIKIKKKTLDLYRLLSRSDFRGNYDDAYTIEQLFTLLCLDVTVNVQQGGNVNGSVLLDLAKEVIRIAESDSNELSNFSIINWCRAMLKYMEVSGKKYKQIHSMSTYELRDNVRQYLEKEDE